MFGPRIAIVILTFLLVGTIPRLLQDINVGASSCAAGFYLDAAAQCQQICGDGLDLTYSCDDGNTNNGDGCSQYCVIESGFVCTNGSATTPSVCSYNGSLGFTLSQCTKDTFSNSLKFILKISPDIGLLSTKYNYSSLLTTNATGITLNTFVYSSGTLTFNAGYTTSQQAVTGSFTLAYPSISQTYAMSTSTTTFTISPYNNQIAESYDSSTYSGAAIIDKFFKACVIIGFMCCLLGTVVGGVLVLEIMCTYQLIIISTSLMPGLDPKISALTNSGRLVFGYNQMFTNFPSITSFLHPTVSNGVYGMQYEAEFIYNYNYMFLIQTGLIFVAFLIMFFDKAFFSQCQKARGKGIKLGWHLAKDGLLNVVLFNIINAMFSFGVSIMYDGSDPKGVMNFIIGILSVGFVVIEVGMIFLKAQEFQLTRRHFRSQKAFKVQPAIIIIERGLLGAVLAGMGQSRLCSVVVLGLEAIYLAYICIKQPYKKKPMFIRAIVNQSLILGIFTITFIMSPLLNLPLSSTIYSIIGIVYVIIVAGVLGLHLFTISYLVYLKWLRKEGEEEKEHQEEDSPEKQENQKLDQSEVIGSVDNSREVINLDPPSKRKLKSRKIIPE